MRSYYFAIKDGVTVRDRIGVEFPTDAEAIEHSKTLVDQIRQRYPAGEPGLLISVIDESGAEVHREIVNAPVDLAMILKRPGRG